MDRNTPGGSAGATLFTLRIDAHDARARRKAAPAARPHADKRRKPPRHRPDHLRDLDR